MAGAGAGQRLNLDAERVIRTPAEMAAEADVLRALLAAADSHSHSLVLD